MKLLLYILLASVVIYFSLAVALIFSQDLRQLEGGSGIDFQNTSRQIGRDPGLSHFIARDGERLGVRHYDGVTADAPLVVLLHGSGWLSLKRCTRPPSRPKVCVSFSSE